MHAFRTLQPALAALLAAIVLLVSLAAWSPALHERLHKADECINGAHEDAALPDGLADSDHDHGASHLDSDHSCAVTLFASGCERTTIYSLPKPAALHAEGVASFTALLLARALPGPERVCGPPSAA